MSEHYAGKIEPLDLMAAHSDACFMEFCRGNVYKYLYRYDRKGAVLADLHKAQTYLRLLAAAVAWRMANPDGPLPSVKQLREYTDGV